MVWPEWTKQQFYNLPKHNRKTLFKFTVSVQMCSILQNNSLRMLLGGFTCRLTHLVAELSGAMFTQTSLWCKGSRGSVDRILSNSVSRWWPTALPTSRLRSTNRTEALDCVFWKNAQQNLQGITYCNQPRSYSRHSYRYPIAMKSTLSLHWVYAKSCDTGTYLSSVSGPG